MLKKVFIIIIIILSFVFYGCSSMPDARNSTVLLYLSHKVEGPIYIPRADSGKEYDKPVDNTKASKKEKAKADTSKKEDKTTATKTTKTDTKEDKTKTATAKSDTSKTEDKTTTATAKADTSKKQQEKVDSSKKEDKTTATKTTKTDTKEDKTTATKTTKTDTKEDKTKTATAKADTSKTEDKTKTTTATAKADTSKKQQEKVDSSKRNDINYQYVTNTYNGYQTRVTDGRGEMLILEKPIRFAFEKYNVTSDYNESIKYVADYLKENTNVRMVVEGHTDRVGPKAFNKGLSSRRSRAVITKLTRAGIKRDRLISSGVDFRYLEYNLNRLNRRVEFIIIRDDEDLANYKEKVE